MEVERETDIATELDLDWVEEWMSGLSELIDFPDQVESDSDCGCLQVDYGLGFFQVCFDLECLAGFGFSHSVTGSDHPALAGTGSSGSVGFD